LIRMRRPQRFTLFPYTTLFRSPCKGLAGTPAVPAAPPPVQEGGKEESAIKVDRMNPYPFPYNDTPRQIGGLSPLMKNDRISDACEKGSEGQGIEPAGKGDLRAAKGNDEISRSDPGGDHRPPGGTAYVQDG